MKSAVEIMITTLTAARDDIEAFAKQQQPGFVVTMKDTTPFRKAADGTIRLFGGEIYVGNKIAAGVIAHNLHRQNENVNPEPQPAADWAVTRIAVINNLIAVVKEKN